MDNVPLDMIKMDSLKERSMDSSTNFQAPPHAAYFLSSCDKVYHKQEVCFLAIGLKLTMYSYKWSWLTVVELSIAASYS